MVKENSKLKKKKKHIRERKIKEIKKFLIKLKDFKHK